MMMLVLALLGVSCHSGDHSTAGSSHETATHEVDHDGKGELVSLEIVNVRTPSDHMVTGGQLTQEQMVALHEQGYETFINLRPVEEEGTGWEEEFTVAQGISFTRIPVAGAADVSRESAERLAEALSSSGSTAVVYCKSGNRVGALLALKAHYVDGQSGEDALQFGLDAGLTRLEPLVRELLELPESDS
jgi:uncharacterized protein (TIGR01244 family)